MFILMFVSVKGHKCFSYNNTKINKKEKTGKIERGDYSQFSSCIWKAGLPTVVLSIVAVAQEAAELIDRFKSVFPIMKQQLFVTHVHSQRKKKAKQKLNSQPRFPVISNRN